MTFSEKKDLVRTMGKDLLRIIGWPKPYKVPLIPRDSITPIDLTNVSDEYRFELSFPKI